MNDRNDMVCVSAVGQCVDGDLLVGLPEVEIKEEKP